jgi:RNA polymerase sigma factor (sigma-70 family)
MYSKEDQIAFLSSPEIHSKLVFVLAKEFPAHFEAASEAVDIALTAAVCRIKGGAIIDNAAGYAYRSALRRLLRHIEKLKPLAGSEYDIKQHQDQAADDPAENAERAEMIQRLGEALLRLTDERDRKIIELHFYRGMPIDQVAESIQISRSSAFARRRRAIKLLRSWIL